MQTLPCRETAQREICPLGSSVISQPPQLISLNGSGREPVCSEGIWWHTAQKGNKQTANLQALNQKISTSYTHTHLSPGVLWLVPPVAHPSPTSHTRVPLLVFSVSGRKINSICPTLQMCIKWALATSTSAADQARSLTPFSVGSPPKFSSTYQSASHSQFSDGTWKPSRGWCCSPVTSLHCQRSLGNRRSEKPSTGFHRCHKTHLKQMRQLSVHMLYVVLSLVKAYLIFISLFPEANRYLAGVDTQVNVMITGDAPAALERSCDAFELQVSITALFPLLTCCRQAVNPPIHIYSPQQGARHGALCNTYTAWVVYRVELVLPF